MDDDDAKLAAWVAACCILGGLAVVLTTMAVRSCT